MAFEPPRLVPFSPRPHQGSIAGGDGGPHDPGMEARITRLEEDSRLLRADVSAMRADVAYIRGRLESLPTTWQMIGSMVGAVVAGNVGLAGVLFAAIKMFGH